jgi:SAM-dependent methyltransferase
MSGAGVWVDDTSLGEPSRDACRLCGCDRGNRRIMVQEMMYGTGEWFPYLACRGCGCLQILDSPRDLGRYYPTGYYSFMGSPPGQATGAIHRALRRARDESALWGRGSLGRWLVRRHPHEALQSLSRIPGLRRDSRILDVGCGAGALLQSLHRLGFVRLLGLDPFLEAEVELSGEPKILRRRLEDVTGAFDVIMFHHSFEHLADPGEVMKQVRERLAPGGQLLVRGPIVPSEVLERYGRCWIQWEPPRHLFLHSRESMARLAEAAGLRLLGVICDSNEFQLWGSEQCARGIPLLSERSYAVNPSRSLFTVRQISSYRRISAELNRRGRGDQAAWYFAHAV